MVIAAQIKEELARQIGFVRKGTRTYEQFYHNVRLYYEMITEED